MLTQVQKMPDDEYHSLKDVVSSTALKMLAKSPAHLKHWMSAADPLPDTDSLRIGKALHALLLDDHGVFVRKFRVKQHPWNTKPGIQEKREFENLGLTPISQTEMDMLDGIRETFDGNAVIGEKLSASEKIFSETAILWSDSGTGVPCRAKPDVFTTDNGVMIDVKTARDASPQLFLRQFFQLGYDIQAAHYAAAWGAVTGKNPVTALEFLFWAVEKTPPFGSCLYRVSTESMRDALKKREFLMEKYYECLSTNLWPGYNPGIHEITPLFNRDDALEGICDDD